MCNLPWLRFTALKENHISKWASYQIRKIMGCACAGNAWNVFHPPTSKETAIWRSWHALRHVLHTRAVMHAGISNRYCREKRSQHLRCMRNPQFYASGKRPVVWNWHHFVSIAILHQPHPSDDINSSWLRQWLVAHAAPNHYLNDQSLMGTNFSECWTYTAIFPLKYIVSPGTGFMNPYCCTLICFLYVLYHIFVKKHRESFRLELALCTRIAIFLYACYMCYIIFFVKKHRESFRLELALCTRIALKQTVKQIM